MAFLWLYTVFLCLSSMLSVYAVISCKALKAFLSRFWRLACLCTYKAVYALILAFRGSERVFWRCMVCRYTLPSGIALPVCVVSWSVFQCCGSCQAVSIAGGVGVVGCLCFWNALACFRFRQKSLNANTFHGYAVTVGSRSIKPVRTFPVSALSEISGSGIRFSKKSDQFSHQCMYGWLSDNDADAHTCVYISL